MAQARSEPDDAEDDSSATPLIGLGAVKHRESRDGVLRGEVRPVSDQGVEGRGQDEARARPLGPAGPARPLARGPAHGHTIRKHLKAALARLALPKLTWYEATRHTFASHWVLAGNSLEKLREVMGHSTVQVTERYAHLKPELFGAADRATLKVSLARPSDVGARHGVATDGGDATESTG